MMRLRRLLALRRDCRGAAIVEFAILAPIVLALFLGVLQVGLAMQKYNAVRTFSADFSRFAMVQYASGNRLSNTQLRSYANSMASGTPYLLEDGRLSVTVRDAEVQRVAGAKELTLDITYQLPSLFPTMGIYTPEISYSRPMFVSRV